MRRVVVVGSGFFGRLVARRLREAGVGALAVARRAGAGAARMDAEDEESVRGTLRPGDVVVDTAGPFAGRSTLLIRIALEIGCDVIDLAETLAWSEAVLALARRAEQRGVRLYPACSAVAAVAGACVRAAAMTPDSVDLYLAPASADTGSSRATRRGFASSLGRPIRTYRDGRLMTVRGYGEQRWFPSGRRRGGIVEHAGAVLLPRSWPSLRRAEFWVDPNVRMGSGMLARVVRIPALALLARAAAHMLGPGPLGRHDGVFAVEVRDPARRAAYVFSAPRESYVIAVEPAVIVAERLAKGDAPHAGVLLPHEQITPDELFARVRALGIDVRS